MTLTRWDPSNEMVSLRDAVNFLFQESFVQPTSSARSERGPTTVALPLDVTEGENDFVVTASLPGVSPEDVQTTVQGDTVMIKAESKAKGEKKGENWLMRERRTGSYQRSITLGTPISADKASAQFEDGVLTLTLPKSEQARPKQIKLNAR